MSVLSDRDIKKRLISLANTGLPANFLDLVKQGKIPKELDELLDDGRIIIDPFPDEESFDADTLDVKFGHVVEIPDMPLEKTIINGKVVIRRYTIDFPDDGLRKRLEHTRKVSIEDHARLRFILESDEILEFPPNTMALVHTLEMICVPYDLQMLINGRSSFARCGICVHISSPIFHPGWCGHMTMEVKNDGKFNFNAYPGLAFGAVCFHQLSSKAEVPYLKKHNAKFSGQQ